MSPIYHLLKTMPKYLPLLLLLPLTPLHAQLLFSGLETTEGSSYGYVGALFPVAGDKDQYSVRVWGDLLYYQYDKESETIDATAPGLQLSLGHRFDQRWGWWTPYIGMVHRRVELSPDDPDHNSRGSTNRMILALDAELNTSACHTASLSSSYISNQSAYWLRLRGVCWRYRSHNGGIDLITQGDPQYRLHQVGGVVEIQRQATHSTLLKGGISQLEGNSASPYIGIEFSQQF